MEEVYVIIRMEEIIGLFDNNVIKIIPRDVEILYNKNVDYCIRQIEKLEKNNVLLLKEVEFY
jgi:hypothetical protein